MFIMKKTFIFILLLFAVKIANGETSKVQTFKFDIDDFEIQEFQGSLFITSNVHNLSFDSDINKPALPYIGVKIPIDDGLQYQRHTVNVNSSVIRSEVIMASNPEYVTTNSGGNAEKWYEVTYLEDIYPEKNVVYSGCQKINGTLFCFFKVCPFFYNAKTKELSFITDFIINISLSTKSAKNASNHPVTRLSNVNTDYDYLIITNETLAPVYQKLADWKTFKGVKTKVLSVENIYQEITDNISNQAKVKKAIIDYYGTLVHQLKYVLLGGDTCVVPTEMTYIKLIKADSTIVEKTTPSDLYFACLDDLEWDTNSNGLSGEIDDDIDYGPDIVVTRIPLSDIDETQNVVNRIIKYEIYPDTIQWKDNILMCGNQLTNLYSGDAYVKGENFYNTYIRGYWNGNRTRFYNNFTDFEGGASYDLTDFNFESKFEDGYTFVDMITHGLPCYWVFENMDSYWHLYALRQRNKRNTIITTIACNTNAFDSLYCLSKYFFKGYNSGILGYIGCSREGWFITHPYQLGPSFDYNGEFYKNLFLSSSHQLGASFYESKSSLVELCDTYHSPYRWLHMGLNCLGDPEMPVFLSKPKTFVNMSSYAFYETGFFDIYSWIGNCRFCFSSRYNDRNDYYIYPNTYYVSSERLLGIGMFNICVTHPEYFPYLGIYGDTVYLQGEKLLGDYHVKSKTNTYIGSNVTNRRNQGPVIIEEGKTTIISPDGVTIYNDFEVKKGAELEIKVN